MPVREGSAEAGEHRHADPDARLDQGAALPLLRGEVQRGVPALDVVVLPGYSRPMVRAEDYRRLLDECTYRGDKVR